MYSKIRVIMLYLKNNLWRCKMENEQKARERTERNKKSSIVFMIIFGILTIIGVVMLVNGINMQVDSSDAGVVGDIVSKVLLCVFGAILGLCGAILFIMSLVMLTTKFDGRSRNPINNMFKDTVSEFQDMMDDTKQTLAPKHKEKKKCPKCGYENDADDTICVKCGGGLGE